MIKFLKNNWFKLGILTLAGMCTFSIVTTNVSANDKKKITKSQIEETLNGFNSNKISPVEADNLNFLRLEYLKLEQMEKLNKNLENMNKKIDSLNKDTNESLESIAQYIYWIK